MYVDWLMGVAGLLIVLLTWGSVLSTLVVPRRSRSRLTRLTHLLVTGTFDTVAARFRSYERRDDILSRQGAAIIIIQLAVWLLMFYVGFALVLLAVAPGGVAAQFVQSGSSLLTLGYAGSGAAPVLTIDCLCAATGLIVIALQVSYLPALYASFSRRETEVRLLSTRAGTPAWGPEILARTRLGLDAGDTGPTLTGFYLDWARWAADVSESHANFPVLTVFRSPQRDSSRVVGLLAVMDSAALWLVLSPATAPAPEARFFLRTGSTVLRQIGEILGVAEKPDSFRRGDLELTFAEFRRGVDRVLEAGFPCQRTAAAAWPDFRSWRVNYEHLAYEIADRLGAVPAQWAGPRRTGDEPLTQ